MFELLLNAVKLATSKDARDSAAVLIGLMSQSPEWQKNICTVEARVTHSERERVNLIRDIASQKLKELEYQTPAIKAFRTTVTELVSNAFEHGVQNKTEDRIRMVIEVSPTYISVIVHNSPDVPADVTSWIKNASKHLKQTKKMQRGRGLVMAYRAADILEQYEESGVKAVVYKDTVEFLVKNEDSSSLEPVIVVATSGHSNPSFGRRIVEFLKQRSLTENVILCLHPSDFEQYQGMTIVSDDEDDDEVSHWFSPIFDFVKSEGKGVRLVISDEDLSDLMPKGVVHKSIEAALQSINRA